MLEIYRVSTNSFSETVRTALRNRFGERARFNERLAPHVAYRIGGPADALVFPQTEEELLFLSETARAAGLPITIIGTGTNLLVRDEGIRGIVVSLKEAFRSIEFVKNGGTQSPSIVRTGGGVEKPTFLEWAIQHSLTGLEFSSGVPGTIGGGIFMNAGTKYGSYGDILRTARLFDFQNGGRTIQTDSSLFGYREQSLVKNTLVLWADFELKPGDAVAIRTEVNRIIDERAAKQPLDYPSCGSTFKNPEGHSAGRLIEKAGLKGTTIGGAQISEKHANFILNKNNATARDILTLIDIVKEKVRELFGIELECEVIVLGG